MDRITFMDASDRDLLSAALRLANTGMNRPFNVGDDRVAFSYDLAAALTQRLAITEDGQ